MFAHWLASKTTGKRQARLYSNWHGTPRRFRWLKGVYPINAVDEVTQFEIVISMEKISEHYLIPVLQVLLEAFRFKVINFRSDNDSE